MIQFHNLDFQAKSAPKTFLCCYLSAQIFDVVISRKNCQQLLFGNRLLESGMTLAESSAKLSIYSLSQITSQVFERKQTKASRTEFQSFSQLTPAHLMLCISRQLKPIPLSFYSHMCNAPICYHQFCGKQCKIFCVCHQKFAVESIILFLPSST